VVLAGAGIAASRLGGARTSTATRPAQPTPAAGPTIPAAFARQCDKAVLAGPGHPVAVFRDGNGLLAWLDYGAFSALCSYDGTGRLIEASTARRFSAYPGYLPGSGPPASVEQVVARPPSVWVLGAARRGVTMLRVTWPGAAPATVTVSGPFSVARATLPPAQPADVEPVIVAYDEDGHVVP
jgi:hypothetical protein